MGRRFKNLECELSLRLFRTCFEKVKRRNRTIRGLLSDSSATGGCPLWLFVGESGQEDDRGGEVTHAGDG